MNIFNWLQLLTIVTIIVDPAQTVTAFSIQPSVTSKPRSKSLLDATKHSVEELKKVLEREYVSFFNPMRTEYYAKDVTFDDPLTNLAGVDAYKKNVDMLAGRTLLGSILFEDGGINLHSVTGGEISSDGSIEDIVTRWTLRFTMKVFFWKPTARFSGISVYKVKPIGDRVQISAQLDYWDSINLKDGGVYEKVDRGVALADFLNQLKPGGFQASSAAPELPFALLRRGKDYEVRKYPAYTAVKLQYERRDEGFGTLGAFTTGTEPPQGPAIMNVEGTDTKYMQWPLTYAAPGSDGAPEPKLAIVKSSESPWKNCEIIAVPAKVVAVVEFSDASLEPVVRKADRQLRASLHRDGLDFVDTGTSVTFAQYDAIFSMGKRRGEVWIDLKDGGHPW
jgi:SOUL heme-binding protein/Uncharacterized conserved protein (DUF2358)